jgi:hypothetical protein
MEPDMKRDGPQRPVWDIDNAHKATVGEPQRKTSRGLTVDRIQLAHDGGQFRGFLQPR